MLVVKWQISGTYPTILASLTVKTPTSCESNATFNPKPRIPKQFSRNRGHPFVPCISG